MLDKLLGLREYLEWLSEQPKVGVRARKALTDFERDYALGIAFPDDAKDMINKYDGIVNKLYR